MPSFHTCLFGAAFSQSVDKKFLELNIAHVGTLVVALRAGELFCIRWRETLLIGWATALFARSNMQMLVQRFEIISCN